MPLSGSSLAHDVLGKYASLHFLELYIPSQPREKSNRATGISDFRKSPPLASQMHKNFTSSTYFQGHDNYTYEASPAPKLQTVAIWQKARKDGQLN